ncbi:Hypothetical protein, putative [Bodo saltans]|uniref:FYVE-type domain-containing protein n=1 Tax=Bodo saltans TaxID=75058 RepID=A0A0S4IZ83_BODSA|nr:Hypothetical protein, putative [Bodo saltans]|eukprot:CUG06873.1 Hypothetical protein, putative [Bodo saltans]
MVQLAIERDYNAIVFATTSVLKKFESQICELISAIPSPLLLWQQLPSSIRHQRAIAIALLKRSGMTLDQMPSSIQNDEEAVVAAVENNGDAIRFACRSLRGTKRIALMAVQRDGLELQDLPSAMTDDIDVVTAAVRQNTLALQFASRRLRGNTDLVSRAVLFNPSVLLFASDDLQADPDLATRLISRNPAAFVDLCRSAKQKREISLAAVKRNGLLLKEVPSEFQKDPDVVLAAVTQNGDAIQFASRSLRADKGLALVAVRRDGMELRDLANSLQKDVDVVLAAVTQNGDALQFACRSLRANKQIALIAVSRDGLELRDVSSNLQNDDEVVSAACQQNGLALQFASKRLRGVASIVKLSVQRAKEALQYASVEQQCDDTIAVPVVTFSPIIFSLLCDEARAVESIALAACKAHGSMFMYIASKFRTVEAFALASMATYPSGYSNLPTVMQRNRNVVLTTVTVSGIELVNAPSEFRKDKGIVMAAMRNNRVAFQFADGSLKSDTELLTMLNDDLRYRFTGNWGIPLPQTYWVAACPKSSWVSDGVAPGCAACNKEFGMFRRRHHCRACGHVICGDCSFVGVAMANKSRGLHRCCTQCFQASRLHVQIRRSIGIPLVPHVEKGVEAYHTFLETTLGVPRQYCPFMDLVTAADIAVILDDSGSMKFPTNGAGTPGKSFAASRSGSDATSRWLEMQAILSNMFDVWSWLGLSIDVVFMNRNRVQRGGRTAPPPVSSMAELQSAFDAPPYGGTPSVTTLQSVFSRRLSNDASRPLLTYLFTDGEPDGSFEAFERFIEDRPHKQHSLLSVILCTDETEIVERYRRLENEVVLMPDGVWNSLGISGVDVTEDYAGEARDVALAGRPTPLLPGEYLVKCMVGALDPAVHLIDLPARPTFWRQPPVQQADGGGGD